MHKRLHLAQYSLLAIPLAFAGLPVYLHAPAFYASELGISLAKIGAALLALRVVDAVQDPLIGSLSDKFHHQRRYIIVAGMTLLALGFWMVFHPATGHPLSWFAAGVLLCTTGFSVISINFHALGGLWIAGVTERTRITSWREAVGLVSLLAAAVAPTLLGAADDASAAFHLLALLYVPLVAICGFGFLHWMGYAALQSPLSARTVLPFRQLGNAWNIRFFGIYFCNAFAGAIPAVLVIFFVNDRINAANMTGLFLALYFLSGACAMPFWQWLAERLGKQRAWMLSMWLAVITFTWAFTLAEGDTVFYGIICILSGSALGADLALPPAIIADRIHDRQDQGLAARYFAVLAFLSKAALALATGIALPVLGVLGYQPGDVGNYAVTDYLSYAYALIPSLFKAAVAIWLWRFIQSINEENPHHDNTSRTYEHVNVS